MGLAATVCQGVARMFRWPGSIVLETIDHVRHHGRRPREVRRHSRCGGGQWAARATSRRGWATTHLALACSLTHVATRTGTPPWRPQNPTARPAASCGYPLTPRQTAPPRRVTCPRLQRRTRPHRLQGAKPSSSPMCGAPPWLAAPHASCSPRSPARNKGGHNPRAADGMPSTASLAQQPGRQYCRRKPACGGMTGARGDATRAPRAGRRRVA